MNHAGVTGDNAHLYGKGILLCADNVCHVKFGRQAAVLAVSQELPIEPAVEGIIDCLKMDGDPAMHAAFCQIPGAPCFELLYVHACASRRREGTPLAFPGGWNAKVLSVAPSGVVLWHERGSDWPGVLKVRVYRK